MAFEMIRNFFILFFTLVFLFGGVYSVSASSSPARIVSGFLSKALSMVMKWVLISLKATTKTAISGRPVVKFESGFSVETVFDGSKLGVEPHSVEILPDGNLLILDSANSNLYKISSSLSLYSKPKLVLGSADGFHGHVDGKLKEARMNHPKGLTVDDSGNIYIADTENLAIRKISDAGVTTIAGGKGSRGGVHVDGPSEDANFSNDFDVFYVGSSCSLLVIDRGNKAIRDIQLHFDDCAYQYGSNFPLGKICHTIFCHQIVPIDILQDVENTAGIAVIIAAGFFGYMLALIQHRVGFIGSSKDESSTYQNPLKSSTLSPLISTEDENGKQEESFLGLIAQTVASSRAYPVFIKKPVNPQYQSPFQNQEHEKYSNTRPLQESFAIPDEDDPPFIENINPTPQKTYAFMSKDSEKMQQLRQSHAFYSGLK